MTEKTLISDLTDYFLIIFKEVFRPLLSIELIPDAIISFRIFAMVVLIKFK
jgi:hypothetical protein